MPCIVRGLWWGGDGRGHVIGNGSDEEGWEFGSQSFVNCLRWEAETDATKYAALPGTLYTPVDICRDVTVEFIDNENNHSWCSIVCSEDTVLLRPALVGGIENSLASNLTECIDNVEAELSATVCTIDPGDVDCFLGAVVDEAQLVRVQAFVNPFGFRGTGGLTKRSFGDVGTIADGSRGGVLVACETFGLLLFGELVKGRGSRGGEEEVDIDWGVSLSKCCK